MRRGGKLVDLSPTEFNLLRYLLTNAGRVVSKAQILDRVWSYDFGGDGRIVESYVYYLRTKIDKWDPPLIHTVRGVGYALRLPRGGERRDARLRPLAAVDAADPDGRGDRGAGRGRRCSSPTSPACVLLRSYLVQRVDEQLQPVGASGGGPVPRLGPAIRRDAAEPRPGPGQPVSTPYDRATATGSTAGVVRRTQPDRPATLRHVAEQRRSAEPAAAVHRGRLDGARGGCEVDRRGTDGRATRVAGDRRCAEVRRHRATGCSLIDAAVIGCWSLVLHRAGRGARVVRIGLRPLTRMETARRRDRRRRPVRAGSRTPTRTPSPAGWASRSTRCWSGSRRRWPTRTASRAAAAAVPRRRRARAAHAADLDPGLRRAVPPRRRPPGPGAGRGDGPRSRPRSAGCGCWSTTCCCWPGWTRSARSSRSPVDLLEVAADTVRDAHVRVPTRFVAARTAGRRRRHVRAGDRARRRGTAAPGRHQPGRQRAAAHPGRRRGRRCGSAARTGAADEPVERRDRARPPCRRADAAGADAPVAVIEVADTGPGLPPGDAARVFERLYRADAQPGPHATAAPARLSIVAAIVQAHGGRCELWTAPGAGRPVPGAAAGRSAARAGLRGRSRASRRRAGSEASTAEHSPHASAACRRRSGPAMRPRCRSRVAWRRSGLCVLSTPRSASSRWSGGGSGPTRPWSAGRPAAGRDQRRPAAPGPSR